MSQLQGGGRFQKCISNGHSALSTFLSARHTLTKWNFLSANPPLLFFKQCNIDEDVVDADDWDEIQKKTKTLSGGGRRTANRSYPRVIRHTTSLNSFCMCFLDDGSCWRIGSGSPGGMPPNLRSQTDYRFNCLTMFVLFWRQWKPISVFHTFWTFLGFQQIAQRQTSWRNGMVRPVVRGVAEVWIWWNGDFSPLYQVNGTYIYSSVCFFWTMWSNSNPCCAVKLCVAT